MVGWRAKVVLGCSEQFVKLAPTCESKKVYFPTQLKGFVLLRTYKTGTNHQLSPDINNHVLNVLLSDLDGLVAW